MQKRSEETSIVIFHAQPSEGFLRATPTCLTDILTRLKSARHLLSSETSKSSHRNIIQRPPLTTNARLPLSTRLPTTHGQFRQHPPQLPGRGHHPRQHHSESRQQRALKGLQDALFLRDESMYLLMTAWINTAGPQGQRSQVCERGVFGESEEVGFRASFDAGPVRREEARGGRGAFAGDIDEGYRVRSCSLRDCFCERERVGVGYALVLSADVFSTSFILAEDAYCLLTLSRPACY